MNTPLYLILDDVGNGNRDLIVAARNTAEAVAHWQDYYEEDDKPERAFAIQATGAPGPLAWHRSTSAAGYLEELRP